LKTIGLIGGISWHSTAFYYASINNQVAKQLGDFHSAKILLHSIDYAEFKYLQSNNDWQGIDLMLTRIALNLEQAGANFLLIGCNAAHMVADSLAEKINVPLLHIAEATAQEIMNRRMRKVGLIGTTFTMEGKFFTDRLKHHQIETIIPEEEDRNFIHASILNEFAKGIFKNETKEAFLKIINKLKYMGCESIILGCTEIGLLLKQQDCDVPLLDTVSIHAKAAVQLALN